MRSHLAMPLIAFALALLAPAVAVAQIINGDYIILTDTSPEIVFTDTDDTAAPNWAIRGNDEFFQIADEAAQEAYLNISPTLFSFGLGYSTLSAGTASSALGYSANSSGPYSTSLGYYAASSGIGSTAVGAETLATGNSSVAIGQGAGTASFGSSALGYLAQADGDSSAALGAFAFADQPNTVILGSIAEVNDAAAYANIGIGTHTPVEAVDVERSAMAARFQLTAFTSVSSEAPQFIQRRARGTASTPAAVQSNDNLGLFSFRGYNGTAMGGSRATITAQAAGNFSASSTPTRLIFSTTPVGSTAPQSVLVITPDGKVQVKGVNLNVPDYVFEDDYELMPLNELKTFIDKNGHLPGIAPAHEVQSEGLDLAGSQMDLLEKVEELTLYTLQQEQRLKELQLKADKVDRLEELVSLLMQERDKS